MHSPYSSQSPFFSIISLIVFLIHVSQFDAFVISEKTLIILMHAHT